MIESQNFETKQKFPCSRKIEEPPMFVTLVVNLWMRLRKNSDIELISLVKITRRSTQSLYELCLCTKPYLNFV